MIHDHNVRCRCIHHYIVPSLIALTGIILLLGNLDLLSADSVGVMWPSFIALIGLQLMFNRRCKCYGEHHHCHHCDSSEPKNGQA